MSTIPHPNLWIPGERFRDSLARKRNWLRRLRAPWVNFSGEDYVDATTGKLVVDATTGEQKVNSGSGNGCCLYQARKCSDDSLAGIYVNKSQFPSFPSTFTFWDGTQCLYAQASDVAPCNSSPLATVVAYADCSACTSAHGGGGAPVVALVTFEGISPCGGGDCGYGPSFPDIDETVMGPTFCLNAITPLSGDNRDWAFSNTGYVAAYNTPCGTHASAITACMGLQILLEQTQDTTTGDWYFALSTFWNTRCNSDPTGAFFSFFINDGRQNMTAAGITDLRGGAAPVAGDSYTGDNDQPSSNCTSFPLGNGNTWGYGGSATITFAATCPTGSVLSNDTFSLTK